MPSVLAVNNYPTDERFARLTRCLEANGAEVSVAGWTDCSASLFDRHDGVVLSGSPDMMSTARAQRKYGREIEAVRRTKAPVLGVCYGHQLIAVAFGSTVVKDKHVLGFVRTEALSDDPLFEGLSNSMMLLESREEVVGSLPPAFGLLARSSASKIAAMKHLNAPIYGVQFHPERFTKTNPDGNAVVGNFVRTLG